MKCQILYSGKNKKNIINLSSAVLAKRMISVKQSVKCQYSPYDDDDGLVFYDHLNITWVYWDDGDIETLGTRLFFKNILFYQRLASVET